MKDLAEETGLTVATVSRALAGKGQLSAATRRTVREAAERLNYEPDPALGRLAAWRWGGEPKTSEGTQVAVLTDDDQEPLPAYTRRRIEGLRNRAHSLGYAVEVLHLRDFGGSVKRLAEVLKARGIRGVVVERINHHVSFAGFPWEAFAAVGCGLGEERLPIPTVTDDVFAGVRLLWARARERGYRRVGVALTFKGKPDPYYRQLSAVKLEQQERLRGESVIPPLSFRDPGLSAENLGSLQSWITKHAPDVILGNRFVLEYLRELQMDIPGSVAYAARLSAEAPGELTGLRPNLFAVGELALDLCDLALRRGQRRGLTAQVLHLVEPVWVEGKTLPPKENSAR